MYMVRNAYGVFDNNLIVGGNSWITSQRFDVQARLDPAGAPYPRKTAMLALQRILADRFQLKIRHVVKVMNVYALVSIGNGQKLVKSMASGDESCAVVERTIASLIVHGCSMSSLANLLHFLINDSVVDKTGVGGLYDCELHWAPNNRRTLGLAPNAGIYAALERQLGLRLQRVTSPMDTIVIDRALMPSGN
jgi:uncharacterized protein (TIGR03435 family)